MNLGSVRYGSAIALCLFFLPLLAAAAESVEVSRSVNLRGTPTTTAPILRTLQPPEVLLVLEENEDRSYLRVRTELEEEGWVWRQNTKAASAAARRAARTSALGVAASSHCPGGTPRPLQEAVLGSTQEIDREGYELLHSALYKIPYWVCEAIRPEQLQGSATRSDRFVPDPKLPAGQRAELADYARSGYDRGHLAPAGNQVRDQRLKDETFFLSNMAPQVPEFNRQVWGQLEDLVRGWAEERPVLHVITGPLFYDEREDDATTRDGYIDYYVIGPDEVAVPTHFFKIVAAPLPDGSWEAVGFVLANRGYDRPYAFADYIRPIDWIERTAGFDWMPELSPADEERLERSAGRLLD